MASFQWGGKTWGAGDLAAFKKFLQARGVSYQTWAQNHPDSARILSPTPAPAGPSGSWPGIKEAVARAAAAEAVAQGISPSFEKAVEEATRAIDAGEPTPVPINWSTILGQYSLPPDIVAELDNIWRLTDYDPAKAIPIAQAYVRGTQWYRDTYPGITEGMNAGLYGDEQGYRVYQNQINQIFSQYYGRAATTAEVGHLSRTGKSVQRVAQEFEADAFRGTLSDPLKVLFNEQEIVALLNQQAGIDTALGKQIGQRAEMAMRVMPLYQDFYGRAITRGELDAAVQQGLNPETIAKNFATQANINGMNPAVRDLFSPDEIRQIALDAAGGVSEFGRRLADMANLAVQLNSVYHTFTGEGVTRDEVNAAYQGGLTAEEVQRRLHASSIAGSLPDFLREVFSTEDLRAAAGATAGSDLSANALRMQGLVNAAPDYNTVIRQYENRYVTRGEVEGFVNTGKSADLLSREYQAKGFVASQGGRVQQALGSFGPGEATPEELTTLGQQVAGIDTILGQQLEERLRAAQERLRGVFEGTLAKSPLALVGGRLASSNQRRPDIGA